MSLYRTLFRTIFGYKNVIMGKDYLAFREEAIRWINGKRVFSQGIDILERSGFKPGVVGRLKRVGENGPAAPARLKHLMLTLIQAWALPESELQDSDLEHGVQDGKDIPVTDPVAELSMKEVGDQLEAGGLEQLPQEIKDIVFEFRRAYIERDKLHRMLAGLGEDNSMDVVEKRKNLSDGINRLSEEMDRMYPLFDEYVKKHAVRTVNEPKPYKEIPTKREGNIEAMPTENLKFMKKSLSTKILRATNRLLYQSETKQEKANPMPDGPERVKYETKIKMLSGRLEQIKMELARRVEC